MMPVPPRSQYTAADCAGGGNSLKRWTDKHCSIGVASAGLFAKANRKMIERGFDIAFVADLLCAELPAKHCGAQVVCSPGNALLLAVIGAFANARFQRGNLVAPNQIS